jgi:uncharacterized protein YbjT (DUF2867 family)
MKIVVIGGTGLIGSKLVGRLRQLNHEVLPASPDAGVDTITGEGLGAALAGARVVVDVANSPLFEDAAVMHFFETSGRNLLAAEAAAGVGHHVADPRAPYFGAVLEDPMLTPDEGARLGRTRFDAWLSDHQASR